MRKDPEARRQYLREWRKRNPGYHREMQKAYRIEGKNDWKDQLVRKVLRELA